MTDLKINTYPLHIGDWHGGTSRMSLAERGAYITLCNQYYLDQGEGWTLTECQRLCAAMSRDEQKAVKAVLTAKFEQVDGGYRHAGMDQRIADIQAASERNQERARRAANARHHGKPKHSSVDATSNAHSTDLARLEECDPKAKSQKPKEENLSNDKSSSSAGASAAAPKGGGRKANYARFFNDYPNKAGIVAAELLWDAAVAAGTDPAEIIAGMDRWRLKWARDKTEPKFVPNPSTWLEERRWLDPIEVPAAVAPKLRRWTGPDAIREAVVIERNEAFAVQYLDGAAWDGREGKEAIVVKSVGAQAVLCGLIRLKSYQIRVEEAQAA